MSDSDIINGNHNFKSIKDSSAKIDVTDHEVYVQIDNSNNPTLKNNIIHKNSSNSYISTNSNQYWDKTTSNNKNNSINNNNDNNSNSHSDSIGHSHSNVIIISNSIRNKNSDSHDHSTIAINNNNNNSNSTNSNSNSKSNNSSKSNNDESTASNSNVNASKNLHSEDNLYCDTTISNCKVNNSENNINIIDNQDNDVNNKFNDNNNVNNINIAIDSNKQSEQLESTSSFRTPLSMVNTFILNFKSHKNILSTNSATTTTPSECTEKTDIDIDPITEEEKLHNAKLRKIVKRYNNKWGWIFAIFIFIICSCFSIPLFFIANGYDRLWGLRISLFKNILISLVSIARLEEAIEMSKTDAEKKLNQDWYDTYAQTKKVPIDNELVELSNEMLNLRKYCIIIFAAIMFIILFLITCIFVLRLITKQLPRHKFFYIQIMLPVCLLPIISFAFFYANSGFEVKNLKVEDGNDLIGLFNFEIDRKYRYVSSLMTTFLLQVIMLGACICNLRVIDKKQCIMGFKYYIKPMYFLIALFCLLIIPLSIYTYKVEVVYLVTPRARYRQTKYMDIADNIFNFIIFTVVGYFTFDAKKEVLLNFPDLYIYFRVALSNHRQYDEESANDINEDSCFDKLKNGLGEGDDKNNKDFIKPMANLEKIEETKSENLIP
eukprot:Pgem_evm1s14875